MKTSKPLSLLLSLLTALAVLSGSIAAPLLCRPFYYAHIDALGLVEYTGLTREQITEAFDQMMDYCLGQRPNFAAGVLPFSASGASHFADVRGLFLLDLWVLVLSLAGLVVFHALFFPGKENWLFNWWEDPVILILPQEFFRNCAVLVLTLLLTWCAVLIGADLWAASIRKKRREEVSRQGGCSGCPGCQG